MSVCLYVSLYVSFSFFAIYQATHTSKFVIICNIFLRMPLWKKKFQKFSVRGCTALFGHQVQNNFFALIKKIYLQTLVEIIFRYHKTFFMVRGPPGEPLRTKWKFLHVMSWVSKLSKKGALSSFLKEFLENIQIWRFWS